MLVHLKGFFELLENGLVCIYLLGDKAKWNRGHI